MRKVNENTEKENELVQVLGNGPIPEVHVKHSIPGTESEPTASAQPVFAQDSVVRRSAVVEADETVTVPPTRWFRVMRGGVILEGGFRTRLKEGKEINDQNYNIRRLQQQGIQLQPFDPNEERDQPIQY